MFRSVVAVAVMVGASAAVSGCSTDSTSGSGATSTVTSAAVPSTTTGELPGGLPADPAALRKKTCTDWVEFFTQATVSAPQMDPNWTPAFAVKGIVKEMGESPEFASLSAAQQAAIVAGVEDASNGSCTG